MSQQLSTTHASTGQQSWSQPGGTQAGQEMGLRLQDVETPQQRQAVQEVLEAVQICEFCAEQCVQLGDPNMAECIRLCEDVSELGELAITLIPRNSQYAGTVLQAFTQAAQACAQECGMHQHAHCQECAQILPRAADSVQQFLSTFTQQGIQTGQQGGQMAGQGSQMAGQGGQMAQGTQTGGQQPQTIGIQ